MFYQAKGASTAIENIDLIRLMGEKFGFAGILLMALVGVLVYILKLLSKSILRFPEVLAAHTESVKTMNTSMMAMREEYKEYSDKVSHRLDDVLRQMADRPSERDWRREQS